MEFLEKTLRLCRKNEKWMKLAVIALVVITALVFFGTKGEKEEIVVIRNGETVTEERIESDESEPESSVSQDIEPAARLVVDIDGCIKHPGVYAIDEGTRLYEVIEMAGGLTKSADTTLINQAEVLADGQKIIIPKKATISEGGNGQETDSSLTLGQTADSRININLADADALQEIPGIGPATAEKILAYRETNGKFKTVEEIKNVSGIGEKTFEKMKDKITI